MGTFAEDWHEYQSAVNRETASLTEGERVQRTRDSMRAGLTPKPKKTRRRSRKQKKWNS